MKKKVSKCWEMTYGRGNDRISSVFSEREHWQQNYNTETKFMSPVVDENRLVHKIGKWCWGWRERD